MADRVFNIGDLLTLRRDTLNIPPFTHKCPQGKGKRLNANEVRKTRKIANLRIHVERAIRRLKCFKLLSNIIQLKFKPMCNLILKSAAFFWNIDKPLVKNQMYHLYIIKCIMILLITFCKYLHLNIFIFSYFIFNISLLNIMVLTIIQTVMSFGLELHFYIYFIYI